MVRTPCFHCRGCKFNPWSGNWDLTSHMARPKKRKERKTAADNRNRCSKFEGIFPCALGLYKAHCPWLLPELRKKPNFCYSHTPSYSSLCDRSRIIFTISALQFKAAVHSVVCRPLGILKPFRGVGKAKAIFLIYFFPLKELGLKYNKLPSWSICILQDGWDENLCLVGQSGWSDISL